MWTARLPRWSTPALDTVPAPEPVYVYTNTERPRDVNADGYVSPRDALVADQCVEHGRLARSGGVNLSALLRRRQS